MNLQRNSHRNLRALIVTFTILIHLSSCNETEKQSTQNLPIGEGQGNPVFEFTSYPIGEPAPTTTIALADINNDNWLDIILGNGRHSGGQNGYFLNTGKSSFEGMVQFGYEYSPTIGIAAAFIVE